MLHLLVDKTFSLKQQSPRPAMHQDSDDILYQLIHQLTGWPVADRGCERCASRRRAFATVQRIAPRRDDHIPAGNEFFEVYCRDISTSGFSFLLPHMPDFSSLVAELRGGNQTIYVTADVLHCLTVRLHSSGLIEPVGGRDSRSSHFGPDQQLAKPIVLVGCQFTGRLEKPPDRSELSSA